MMGTSLFFANTNIIGQQHVACVKSPYLRIIDTHRRLSDGNLEISSETVRETFSEHLKKLSTSTIEEIQIELVLVTQ